MSRFAIRTPYLIVVLCLVVLVLGERSIVLGRWLALIAAVATFLISIPAYTGFNTATADLQFVEKLSWIPSLNAFYGIGLDGISLPLVLLTNSPSSRNSR